MFAVCYRNMLNRWIIHKYTKAQTLALRLGLRIVNVSASVLVTQYCASDKIKKNEMGGVCHTFGRGERHVQGFGGETWGKETTEETQAQVGR